MSPINIPPPPPTREEMERADRELVERIVARFSRGCSLLSQGKFKTAKDLEREKQALLAQLEADG